MTRINTNVASLVAISDLFKSNRAMETSLQRLSSGLRINTAKDDPAGLIISELLRSEMTSITKAIDNTERASNVIATAEGALNEVSALLNDIRELVVEAASTGSLTAEEIQANQLQVDSAVESITRIANSTTFGGTQLLNGNMDFTASGIDATDIAKASVQQASFGSAASMTVSYSDVTAATNAATAFNADAHATDGLVIEVTGNRGSMTFSFAGATSAADMRSAIDAAKDVTGVESNGTNLRSVEAGSKQFVQTRIISGSAGAVTGVRVVGTDISGNINGQAFVGEGNVAKLNTTNLKASITFEAGTAASGSFTITGGGARFQIGQDINSNGQVRVGIQSVTASNLGGGTAPGVLSSIVTGGANSLLAGKQSEAAQIVNKSVLDIATMRGGLGALQRNTLDTNVNSLRVTLENLTSSESTIRDTDFAHETANLTRSQILVSAGMSVLATANATPQSVLSLLRG